MTDTQIVAWAEQALPEIHRAGRILAQITESYARIGLAELAPVATEPMTAGELADELIRWCDDWESQVPGVKEAIASRIGIPTL